MRILHKTNIRSSQLERYTECIITLSSRLNLNTTIHILKETNYLRLFKYTSIILCVDGDQYSIEELIKVI